jgi:RNA polymerase sigma factor (sigma-70 family)
MATRAVSRAIGHLREAALRQGGAAVTDGQLLEQYVNCRDGAAFEALVRRHGPMVLGVCRRVLGNEADAEDAFQATFLVLVRKAAAIRSRAAVSNWLYGVAHNTALKAKAMNSLRRTRERQAGTAPRPQPAAEVWHEVRDLLDAEMSRLPDKYRVPIVLCDLEEKTIKEAARQLGWPQGTTATRLARGRALLARRLAQRGLVLSAGALAAALSQGPATARVPPALLGSTIQAARLMAAGPAAAAGPVSAKVAALTEGVLQGMFLTKLKTATVVFLLVAAAAVSAGGLGTFPVRADDEKPGATWTAEGGQGQAGKPTPTTVPGWGGKIIDPDGDCKFILEKGQITIQVPGKDHALCIERGVMNAPRVLR